MAAPWERSMVSAYAWDIEDFTTFIEEATLVDIDMAHGQFTWSNMRADTSCLRLDRLLIFVDWEDHCPHI